MTEFSSRVANEHLIKRHQATVWRYLCYLGCDENEAEDLTQETFIALLRSSFVERSDMETAAYLRRVARNCFLMNRRTKRKMISTSELDEADADWAHFLRDDDGEGYFTALEQCLPELDDKPRQALVLQYTYDMARLEIAAVLEMSDDGVKAMLMRAKARLRECIERRLES